MTVTKKEEDNAIKYLIKLTYEFIVSFSLINKYTAIFSVFSVYFDIFR